MLGSLFFCPYLWLFLSLLFFFLLKYQLIPLSCLAITRNSLINPLYLHTLFTAGLSHKTFLHLSTNLILLGLLARIYAYQNAKASPLSFTKIVLLSNLLHGLSLSILIHANTYTLYLYGSSGIVCALAGFLSYPHTTKKTKSIAILKTFTLGLVLFSLLDIFYCNTCILSSWSHLLGVLLGRLLAYFIRYEE